MGQEPSNPRYAALLQACQDTIMILDGETVVTIHAGSSRWAGQELEGRRLSEILPVDLAEQFLSQLRQLTQGGKVAAFQFQLRPEHCPELRPLGLTEPHWYSARVTLTQEGETLVLMQDITERKRLSRKLSTQAQRDPLTGAYNRRALMPVLDMSVAQALRYDGSSSVILLEVDQLKAINEQHGWDAGDQVLQHSVATLHRLKRTSDFLVRYSDSQLAMVLGETNHEQALLAAERIRDAIAELELPFATGDIRWTVSIGVGSALNPEDDGTQVLKRAYENMLVAIHSGRNRVEGEAL
ncbi:GGDEF domain-containing protein [Marinobacterium stanieri]|uniref:GGDEF domain-containing protein n=1 Tax=Marinobacterium stanieri TaxID=49186 RepID=UPI00025580A8|nr:sensor domain-containing diguanylate cyclase [Marinobacterium stanieri]